MGKGKLKGKLKSVFTKKEGGTLIGNMLRNAGDGFTGGLVSKLMPIPDRAAVEAQRLRRGGSSESSLGLEAPEGIMAPQRQALSGSVDFNTASKPDNKKMLTIGVICLAVIGAIVGFLKMSKRKK